MKKKILAAFLAAVSCMAMSVTAMAAESTQEISAVLTADPTYTVTIPATVNMGNDGTTVDVTASDVENLAIVTEIFCPSARVSTSESVKTTV